MKRVLPCRPRGACAAGRIRVAISILAAGWLLAASGTAVAQPGASATSSDGTSFWLVRHGGSVDLGGVAVIDAEGGVGSLILDEGGVTLEASRVVIGADGLRAAFDLGIRREEATRLVGSLPHLRDLDPRLLDQVLLLDGVEVTFAEWTEETLRAATCLLDPAASARSCGVKVAEATIRAEGAFLDVTLSPAAGDPGLLVGRWRLAGPFVAEGRGGEARWTAGPAEIDDVVVLEDQTALNEAGQPLYVHPFGLVPPPTTTGLVIATRQPQPLATRTLLVAGRHLPVRPGRAVDLVSFDPAIEYRLLAREDDAAFSPVIASAFIEGRTRLAAAGASPDALDLLLVEARLKPGVLPGLTYFGLNGDAAFWTVDFGDATAALSYRRVIDARFVEAGLPRLEAIATAFPLDRLVVEVQLGNDYSVPGFDLRLETGGAGDPPEPARIEGVADGLVRLGPVAGQPGLYRSAPIGLADGTDPTVAEIPLGDRPVGYFEFPGLVRALWTDDRFRLDPPSTLLTLESAPLRVGGAFVEALRRASLCHPDPPDVDWNRLAGAEAERISTLVVLDGGTVLRTTLRFGDHAAMLLLRDEFLRLIRAARAEYGTILADDRLVVGLATALRAAAWDDRIPILGVDVPDPDTDGGVMSLGLFLRLNPEIAPAQLLRPVRSALGRFVAAIDLSIGHAAEIGDCDLAALRDLTGIGFDAVAQTLVPKLMRYRIDDASGRRVLEPDALARGHVEGLAVLAAAVRAQLAAGRADTLGLVTIAAAAVSGGTALALGEGAAVLAVTLAADLADAATQSIDTYATYVASQDELAFALGASAVLGVGRLERARLEEVGFFDLLRDIYVAGAGTLLGSAGELLQLRAVDRVRKTLLDANGTELAAMLRRGEGAAGRFLSGGLDSLSDADRIDLFAFLADAAVRRAGSGADSLTALQRAALSQAEARRSAALRASAGTVPPGTVGGADTAILPGFVPPGSGLGDTAILPGFTPPGSLADTVVLPAPPGSLADTVVLPAPPGSLADTVVLPAPPGSLADTVVLPPPAGSLADTVVVPGPPGSLADTVVVPGPPGSLADTVVLPAPPGSLADTVVLPAPPGSLADTVVVPPPGSLADTVVLPAPPGSLADTVVLPAPPGSLADTVVLPAPPGSLADTVVLPPPPGSLVDTVVLPPPPGSLADTVVLPAPPGSLADTVVVPPPGSLADTVALPPPPGPLADTVVLPAPPGSLADTVVTPVPATAPPPIRGPPSLDDRLAPLGIDNAIAPIRTADGGDDLIPIGGRIGEGSFNTVFQDPTDPTKVIRISQFESDHPFIQFDQFGRDVLDAIGPDIAVVLGYPGGRVLTGVTSDAWDGARTVAILDRFDGPRATDLFRQNPGGAPTPGQAIAYDSAVRALNERGYALIDGHPANFTFEALPGADRWRMVLLDTGGIVRMVGNDPQAARLIQQMVDTPPLDDPLRLRDLTNPVIRGAYQQGRVERIAAELDRVADPAGTGFTSFADAQFNPTGLEGYDGISSLAALDDPAEIAAAYQRLRDAIP